MQAALAGKPRRPFTVPPEVRWRRVDTKSGLLPRAGEVAGARMECFIAGHEPSEEAPPAAAAGGSPAGERRVPIL